MALPQWGVMVVAGADKLSHLAPGGAKPWTYPSVWYSRGTHSDQ